MAGCTLQFGELIKLDVMSQLNVQLKAAPQVKCSSPLGQECPLPHCSSSSALQFPPGTPPIPPSYAAYGLSIVKIVSYQL